MVAKRLLIAQRGGPSEKSVRVEVTFTVFIVAVVDVRNLTGETQKREVLPVQVGHEKIIVAQVLPNIIQTTVGVFFNPLEIADVVLVNVVVAVAKQANAHGQVLEQKAPEVADEWLNTYTQAVEIVAI